MGGHDQGCTKGAQRGGQTGRLLHANGVVVESLCQGGSATDAIMTSRWGHHCGGGGGDGGGSIIVPGLGCQGWCCQLVYAGIVVS